MATMLKLALTGPIAGGKSCVALRLEKFGAQIIDYDILAREAVSPGSAALEQIRGRWGKQMIAPDGTLNRTALAAEVFRVPESLRILNSVLHPVIAKMACAREKEILLHRPHCVIVHNIPLFLGSGLEFCVHAALHVNADRETRIERMIRRRKMTRREAEERIAAQDDPAAVAKMCDVHIKNDATPEILTHSVNWLWHSWISPFADFLERPSACGRDTGENRTGETGQGDEFAGRLKYLKIPREITFSTCSDLMKKRLAYCRDVRSFLVLSECAERKYEK